MSSDSFLPLFLVPAIGLIVILSSLSLTNISGLDPTKEKSSKFNINKKGEGLSFLKDLYSEKGFCLNFFLNLKY